MTTCSSVVEFRILEESALKEISFIIHAVPPNWIISLAAILKSVQVELAQ